MTADRSILGCSDLCAEMLEVSFFSCDSGFTKKNLQHIGTNAYIVAFFTHVCRYIGVVRHTPKLLEISPECVF